MKTKNLMALLAATTFAVTLPVYANGNDDDCGDDDNHQSHGHDNGGHNNGGSTTPTTTTVTASPTATAGAQAASTSTAQAASNAAANATNTATQKTNVTSTNTLSNAATGGSASATGGSATGGSATGGSVSGSGNSTNKNVSSVSGSGNSTVSTASTSSAAGAGSNNGNVTLKTNNYNPVQPGTVINASPGAYSANVYCQKNKQHVSRGGGLSLFFVGGNMTGETDASTETDTECLAQIQASELARAQVQTRGNIASATVSSNTTNCMQKNLVLLAQYQEMSGVLGKESAAAMFADLNKACEPEVVMAPTPVASVQIQAPAKRKTTKVVVPQSELDKCEAEGKAAVAACKAAVVKKYQQAPAL